MLKALTKYDHREAFCKALRSGEYQQGLLYYIDRGRHCAIGVCLAAGIIVPEAVTIFSTFAEKLDLDPERIAMMNDAGKTFEQIAQWIEAQP